MNADFQESPRCLVLLVLQELIVYKDRYDTKRYLPEGFDNVVQ